MNTAAPSRDYRAIAPNTDPPIEIGFIDEPECLRRVHVCRRTWHNLKNTGKVPYMKVGKRVLYCWENVKAALLRLERNSK